MLLNTREIIDRLLARGDLVFINPVAKAIWGVFRAYIVANEDKIIENVEKLGQTVAAAVVLGGDKLTETWHTPRIPFIGEVDDFVWKNFIRPWINKTILEIQTEAAAL